MATTLEGKTSILKVRANQTTSTQPPVDIALRPVDLLWLVRTPRLSRPTGDMSCQATRHPDQLAGEANDTNGDGNGDGDGFICNCAFGYYGTPVANTVYGDSNFVACTRSLSF